MTNSNKTFRKNVILKVSKKQSLHSLQTVHFLKYILRVIFLGLRCGFFKNETSILAFVQLAIFHSI